MSYDKQAKRNLQCISDTAVTFSRSASGSSSETLWCNFILTCKGGKRKKQITMQFVTLLKTHQCEHFFPPFPLRPNILSTRLVKLSFVHVNSVNWRKVKKGKDRAHARSTTALKGCFRYKKYEVVHKYDRSVLKETKVAPPFHSLERSPVEFFAHQPRTRTTCSLRLQPPSDICRSVDEWQISRNLGHYWC